MSRLTKSASLVSEVVSAFQCPICASHVEVIDHKSLICLNNHTFDFAKQGYLNLMTRQSNSRYDQSLFAARHHMIMERGLYDPLHQLMAELMTTELGDQSDRMLAVDLGCGEGSHLHRILREYDEACNEDERGNMTGVGLDIAKEGILMASKRYDDQIWLVGDLAKSPLQDHSFHVLLNILSPSNYSEFKRILAPGGIIVKVVPEANYLAELRNSLFGQGEKQSYDNEQTVALFKEQFQSVEIVPLKYVKKLDRRALQHLLQMTPLSWNADEASKEAFLDQDFVDLTVDVAVLVGKMG